MTWEGGDLVAVNDKVAMLPILLGTIFFYMAVPPITCLGIGLLQKISSQDQLFPCELPMFANPLNISYLVVGFFFLF